MISPGPARTEAAGTVREFLRQRTHAAHVALNHHPMLIGITQPGYSLPRYQALLAAYLPLYAGLEAAIEHYIAEHAPAFEYHSRRKLPWLISDIEFFEQPVSQTVADIPPINNLAELVGVLYVIEGSTLGGGMIARLIIQHLGIDASRGGAFFNAYGADTQSRWQAFCAFCEISTDDPERQNIAALRAEDTFRLFQQALDRVDQVIA